MQEWIAGLPPEQKETAVQKQYAMSIGLAGLRKHMEEDDEDAYTFRSTFKGLEPTELEGVLTKVHGPKDADDQEGTSRYADLTKELREGLRDRYLRDGDATQDADGSTVLTRKIAATRYLKFYLDEMRAFPGSFHLAIQQMTPTDIYQKLSAHNIPYQSKTMLSFQEKQLEAALEEPGTKEATEFLQGAGDS